MMKLKNKISLKLFLAIIILSGMFLFSFSTIAATKEVNFSAYIVDNQGGQIKNGDYTIRFAIYTVNRETADPYPSDSDKARRVWEETKNITVSNGVISTYLGSVTPFSNNFDFKNNDYYLGVRINNDSEMIPRKKFASVLNAIDSLYIQGKTIGDKEGNIMLLGPGGKIDNKYLNLSLTSTPGVSTLPGTGISGSGGVLKVSNGVISSVTTSDIPEGANLYWTQERFNEAAKGLRGNTVVLGGGGSSIRSTSDLLEGTNLYWTEARFDSKFDTAMAAVSSIGPGSALYVDSSGRVGIGTTSPLAKLSVQGTAGANDIFSVASSSGDYLFYISSAGRVGIGTTSPMAKLAVNGSSALSGNVYLGATSTDLITFNGGAVSDLLPAASGLYSLGSETNRWSTLYLTGVVAVGGQASFTSQPTGTGVGNGVIYINPPSVADPSYTLFGIAVNGTEKLRMDATGNIVVQGNLLGPTGGSIGYWTRSGANLYPYTIGDNIGIGTTSPYSRLSVWGSGSGSNSLFELTNSASSTLLRVLENGNTYFSGNVGIGTTTPNNLLSVYQLIDFNNTDYNTKLGYQAGTNIVTGAQKNTFVGYQAGLSSAGGGINADDNTAIGYQSLYTNTEGYQNLALGSLALNANTIGYKNIAIGASSLKTNTINSNNTAVGAASLMLSFGGDENTAIGASALFRNTSGDYNVGLGVNALGGNQTGSRNTGIGTYAGFGVANNSNSNNTLIGYSSGFGLTTGSNNISLGYQSGDNLTSGGNNILIGYDIDAQSVTGSNQLSIGNLIFATGGFGTGTAIGSGNVGIGTTTPLSLLNVVGALGSQTPLFTVSSTTATNVVSPLMTVLANGNVGIGTSSPAAKLDIYGNLLVSGTNSYLNFGTTTGANSYGLRDNSGTIEYKNLNGSWNWFVAGDLIRGYKNGMELSKKSNTEIYVATGTIEMNLTAYFATSTLSMGSGASLSGYTADQTTGGTASASSNYGGYGPGNAFNGTYTSDSWAPSTPTGSWIQYLFSGAKRIRKIKIWNENNTNYMTSFNLYASATGSFTGEQVLLTSGSGMAQGQSSEFAFNNDNSYAYYRVYPTAWVSGVFIAEIEMYEGTYIGGEVTNFSASTIYYVYADIPASGTGLSNSNIVISTTAPAWNNSLGAYYRSDDATQRYLGKFITDASSNVVDSSIIQSQTPVIKAGVADGQLLRYNFAGAYYEPANGFYINNAGNVGIGTTTPYSLLSLSNSAATPANTPLFTIASTTAGTATSTLLTVLANGNVGIGTTEPVAKLDVRASITNTNLATPWNGTVLKILNTDTTNNDYHGLSFETYDPATTNSRYAGGIGTKITGHGTGNSLVSDMLFFTQGANGTGERVRITSNGNVGIGTENPSEKLSVTGNVLIGPNNTSYLEGTRSDGTAQQIFGIDNNNDVVINRGSYSGGQNLASRIRFVIGASKGLDVLDHNAGSLVTFQESGNVGIGTTNPIGKFEVATDGATQIGAFSVYSNTASNEPLFYFRKGRGTLASPSPVQNGDIMGTLRWAGQIDTTVGNFTTGAKIEGIARGTFANGNTPTDIAFYTTPASSETPVERMRVASTGNVGIGTTSPDRALSIYAAPAGTIAVGLNIQHGTGGGKWLLGTVGTSHAWGAGSFGIYDEINLQARLVINSSGSVGIASTSPWGLLSVNANNLTAGAPQFVIGSSTRTDLIVTQAGNVGIGTTSPWSELAVSGTITQTAQKSCANGLTTDANGAINGCAASDISLKTNIASSTYNALSIIGQLSPVSYQWRNPSIKDGLTHSGFIAQSVEAVFPTAITGGGFDEFGNAMKAIDPNAMASLLVKGLQELNASTTAMFENIKFDSGGKIIIGKNPLNIPLQGEQEPEVQIVNITNITASSTQPALVINQAGTGDIADFQANGVRVMNITSSGEVKIIGSMLVDGRIMLCTGGSCSNTLDSAVDATQADLGVEGKVVAGAFEGYCDPGYVWVPGSAKYGTLPGFCVMSDLAGINISQGEAQIACQAMGTGYHLIGENEWLTIAENILQVSNSLATSTAFKLTNDNIVNNLSGTGEWTNNLVNEDDLPVLVGGDWQEYGAVSSYKSLSIIRPPYYLSDAINHIGKIKIGAGAGLIGFIRGENGIYALDLSHAPSEKSADIGYRCAK